MKGLSGSLKVRLTPLIVLGRALLLSDLGSTVRFRNEKYEF